MCKRFDLYRGAYFFAIKFGGDITRCNNNVVDCNMNVVSGVKI